LTEVADKHDEGVEIELRGGSPPLLDVGFNGFKTRDALLFEPEESIASEESQGDRNNNELFVLLTGDELADCGMLVR
jgi:hypothetical protein